MTSGLYRFKRLSDDVEQISFIALHFVFSSFFLPTHPPADNNNTPPTNPPLRFSPRGEGIVSSALNVLMFSETLP